MDRGATAADHPAAATVARMAHTAAGGHRDARTGSHLVALTINANDRMTGATFARVSGCGIGEIGFQAGTRLLLPVHDHVPPVNSDIKARVHVSRRRETKLGSIIGFVRHDGWG